MMDDLYNIIADKTTLQQAWMLVKAKGSAGGIDGVSIQQFDLHTDHHIARLHDELKAGKYVPEPYKSFKIPKNEKEFRKLGLPTVKDKIVQTATKIVIEPVFEKRFLNVSYGYRPEKGPLKAINRIKHRIAAEKRQWVTLADIDNYFDSIKPEILYSLVGEELQSERLMKLIRLWVQIGSINYRQKYEPYTEGIPQGNVLSPLLSNIYLHPFDVFMNENNYGLVRYADDFVVLSVTQQEAQAALKDAKHFLENRLCLNLNDGSKVRKVKSGFGFLHIQFDQSLTSIGDDRFKALQQKLEKGIVIKDGVPQSIDLLQKISGIRAYYGRLIPEQTLLKLDQSLAGIIIDKLAGVFKNTKGNKKRLLDEFLIKLEFFSKEYAGNKSEKIAQIKKALLSAKNKESKEKQYDNTDSLIRSKRSYYEKIANKNRELVVTAQGVFVGINHKGITIKEFGKTKSVVPKNALTTITILSNTASLSGQLIKWCSQNSVAIDFIGFDGLPFAKMFTPAYPDAEISLAQTNALENGAGIELLKCFVAGKIKNQAGLLKYYHKYRKTSNNGYTKLFKQRISQLQETLQKINNEQFADLSNARAMVMGYEGFASTCYWDMIARLLEGYAVFEKRERQGATDLVNCMLNYGYGILYSKVWQAIIQKRLNPCIGFLHATKKGKPTLAFDLIEEFRQQAVDKTVFAMITKGIPVGVVKGQLTPDTRKKIAFHVLNRLNRHEIFRGKKRRLCEIIECQAELLAAHIQGKGKYKPYVAKW
jgi:group II intron reverse transcriptase/maturase/CRISPR-associated endonuclease Cas1